MNNGAADVSYIEGQIKLPTAM